EKLWNLFNGAHGNPPLLFALNPKQRDKSSTWSIAACTEESTCYGPLYPCLQPGWQCPNQTIAQNISRNCLDTPPIPQNMLKKSCVPGISHKVALFQTMTASPPGSLAAMTLPLDALAEVGKPCQSISNMPHFN